MEKLSNVLISLPPGMEEMDRQNLKLFIERNWKWWNHIENVWIIKTNQSPKEVYQDLQVVYTDKPVFIAKLQDSVYGNLPQGAWEWLES